jgi:hypothetical protein
MFATQKQNFTMLVQEKKKMRVVPSAETLVFIIKALALIILIVTL